MFFDSVNLPIKSKKRGGGLDPLPVTLNNDFVLKHYLLFLLNFRDNLTSSKKKECSHSFSKIQSTEIFKMKATAPGLCTEKNVEFFFVASSRFIRSNFKHIVFFKVFIVVPRKTYGERRLACQNSRSS